MSRIDAVTFEFVELLPQSLADGVLYVSTEHGVMVHKCCCGCGERVVNSLGPAQWSVTVEDGRISIDPSIGTGAQACNSHYWIREGKVRWAKPLTAAQTRAAQLADRQDTLDHYAQNAVPWWRFVKRWRARLRRR